MEKRKHLPQNDSMRLATILQFLHENVLHHRIAVLLILSSVLLSGCSAGDNGGSEKASVSSGALRYAFDDVKAIAEPALYHVLDGCKDRSRTSLMFLTYNEETSAKRGTLVWQQQLPKRGWTAEVPNLPIDTFQNRVYHKTFNGTDVRFYLEVNPSALNEPNSYEVTLAKPEKHCK